MKRLARMIESGLLLVALLQFVSGCAGSRTKWECVGASCESLDEVMTKCQAKANAYFIATNDQGFMAQCIRGAGFQQVPD